MLLVFIKHHKKTPVCRATSYTITTIHINKLYETFDLQIDHIIMTQSLLVNITLARQQE